MRAISAAFALLRSMPRYMSQSRIYGERFLDHQCQHRRRHGTRGLFTLGIVHHIDQMRGAGWADLRRLTPVFDAAVVGGFTVRRDHATNRQYAAQSAQNQTYQPTCDRKLGFVPLAVTPLLLLVCFRGFQFVQIVAGTHTFDATCPGIVECGDEVDVLVRAQVTDGEMQRAVRVARRLRCASVCSHAHESSEPMPLGKRTVPVTLPAGTWLSSGNISHMRFVTSLCCVPML